MDDLTAALAGSFQVTSHPNNPAAPHPRFSDYKIKTNAPTQEVRRRRILERQKQSRFDYLSHVRDLTENEWAEKDEDDEEQMDVEIIKPGRYYKNQLMLSEWMMEKPEDFDSQWVMVPCPIGKRHLVVTHGGETRAYSRSGHRIETFPSCLPGGNRSPTYIKGNTVIDCIFNEEMKTFYILDMMCWHGHPFYDCETEFRFYWLQTKMEECPYLKEQTKRHKYSFEALPQFPCTDDSIAGAMANPMNVKMDGVLFYHKQTHYTFGPTPLVVWLKPYMLPDMLGIPVHPKYVAEKPSSYTSLANHLQKVQENKTKREKKICASPKETKTSAPQQRESMDIVGSEKNNDKTSPKESKSSAQPQIESMDTVASGGDSTSHSPGE